MVTVYLPDNHHAERSYCIDTIFGELLGISYQVRFDDARSLEGSCWVVTTARGTTLAVEDHFFSKIPEASGYLDARYLPGSVFSASIPCLPGCDVPVLYGDPAYNATRNTIRFGGDIFASSFFMLTRWEEYVKTERDPHGRFPASASLAYQNGFLSLPVVDLYADMLWNMLLELGIDGERKTHPPRIFPTHDVDDLYFWSHAAQLLRVTAGDLLKRRDGGLAAARIREFLRVKKGAQKDPWDRFDLLMDLSESIGTQSRFYFMSGGVTAYDNRYSINDPRAVELMAKIRQRGHLIGIHASYNSYNDPEQFRKEKVLLEETCGCEITEGRQHYLRFEVPATWRVWEANGMQTDATCGYADCAGFRCGTGKAFYAFDILKREQLAMRERPLVIMDSSLFDYQCYEADERSALWKSIMQSGSDITLLWHNSYTAHLDEYIEMIGHARAQ